MTDPEQAWQMICRTIAPLPSQTVALDAAFGAYLSEPIRADRDIPPADRAAMDGFAVRAADLGTMPAKLHVIGEIAAGTAVTQDVGRDECIRIFTGANVPPGADTVVPVEDTSLGSFANKTPACEVVIVRQISVGANIFRQGENARRSQELLPTGTQLAPTQMAAAAACGFARVRVYAKPQVAILITGAELLAADAGASGTHQTRDSNSPMLSAACQAEGFGVALCRQVPDDLDATCQAVQQAAQSADVVILTGGVSAGQYDFVRPAIESLGATIHFHGIAMKPGKPQLFATLPSGAHVFGLPGNPLSAVIGLHEFVLPGLRLLAGCPAANCRPLLYLPLAAAAVKKNDFLHVIPAVVETGPDGTQVCPRPPIGSADLVTLSVADGAILLAGGVNRLSAGTIVPFRPWRGMCR